MSESMALVGLDVHRAQTVAAVLDPVNGELRVQRLRGEPDRVVPEFLEQLDRPVRACMRLAPPGSCSPGLPSSAASMCESWRRGLSPGPRVTG